MRKDFENRTSRAEGKVTAVTADDFDPEKMTSEEQFRYGDLLQRGLDGVITAEERSELSQLVSICCMNNFRPRHAPFFDPEMHSRSISDGVIGYLLRFTTPGEAHTVLFNDSKRIDVLKIALDRSNLPENLPLRLRAERDIAAQKVSHSHC